jgi:fucose permease
MANGETVARAVAAVVAVQLALFVLLGLPDGALGVAWPSMRADYGRGVGDLGALVVVGTAGYLVASVSVATVTRRLPVATVAAGAALLAAAALAGWALTAAWWVALATALGLGVARGAVDAGLNADVAVHGGLRRLGLLHASYGVGTTGGPLLVVVATGAGSWRWAWAAMAAGFGAAAVATACVHRRWADQPAIAQPAEQGAVAARPTLVVALTVAVFATYVGAEYSTGAWAYTLLTDGRGMADGAAAVAVAAYWAALTLGRGALGLAGHHVEGPRLVWGSCLLALAGVLVVAVDPLGVGWIGLPVAGLGFAAVFPALVALTPARVGTVRSAAVIGWSVAAASVGGAAASALGGVLADRAGPDALAVLFVVATAVLVAMWGLLDAVSPAGAARARPGE